MESFVQDLRHSVRTLARQPGFAITAVLTLALGIGATTAIFSVVNAVVLRPLPFTDAHRIVAVMNLWTKTGQRGTTVSAPDFYDWQEQSRSFSALSSFSGGETSVSVDGVADYAAVYPVSPGFFSAFGVGARLGRLPSPAEEASGGSLAAVITDAFWRRRFNADPGALGTTIKFRERLYTIVGVLPSAFRYPSGADIYTSSWVLGATREAAAHRSAHNFRVVGRLRPDVTLEQANADIASVARRLEHAYPNSNAGKSALVIPLQEFLVGDSRQTLYVLFAAVVFVLLIACANVANLLLARATVREREMVVRAAVGAGRARLVRQLLTESVALAVVSALAGVLLARLGVAALVALAPPDLPRLDEIHVDGVALGFALAISIASSVLFGLAPAVQVSRVQLVEGLRQGGKGSALGARGGWARNAFVIAEVALAVVLVVGAGLLGRSLVALAEVDMGFSPERLLVLRTSVPVSGMDDAPRATAFYRELLPELRATPGVTAVGGVTSLPTAVRSNGGYWLEGGPGPEQTGVRAPQAIFNVVTPDYFTAMRIPLKSGRDFADRDQRDAAFVAIVNEALVREAFPGQDPIGRRIQCGLDTLEFMTIIGVVADVRTRGPARPAQPEIYMPYEQHPAPASAMTIVARTAVIDPLALAETMRRKIRELNPDVPAKAETMDMTLEMASATPRFRTFLLVVFAGVALLLAVAGVYGVMAYTVSQRVPEIGVRVALGAAPADILRMIVGQGAKLAGVGLVVGIALALAASRLLEGLLFGVTGRDPMILAGVTVLMAAAALGACYIPGRRALRVEPMTALRSE
jgi:putative ABC transport system permease protein